MTIAVAEIKDKKVLAELELKKIQLDLITPL